MIVGSLRYRGDIRRDVAGQVIGPAADGSMIVPAQAWYEVERDYTHVDFRLATMEDIEAEMDLFGVPAPGRVR